MARGKYTTKNSGRESLIKGIEKMKRQEVNNYPANLKQKTRLNILVCAFRKALELSGLMPRRGND